MYIDRYGISEAKRGHGLHNTSADEVSLGSSPTSRASLLPSHLLRVCHKISSTATVPPFRSWVRIITAPGPRQSREDWKKQYRGVIQLPLWLPSELLWVQHECGCLVAHSRRICWAVPYVPSSFRFLMQPVATKVLVRGSDGEAPKTQICIHYSCLWELHEAYQLEWCGILDPGSVIESATLTLLTRRRMQRGVPDCPCISQDFLVGV